jgi:hypothetical protein
MAWWCTSHLQIIEILPYLENFLELSAISLATYRASLRDNWNTSLVFTNAMDNELKTCPLLSYSMCTRDP